MYVNTINNVTKRHMPAEREKQEAAVFDSAVILRRRARGHANLSCGAFVLQASPVIILVLLRRKCRFDGLSPGLCGWALS